MCNYPMRSPRFGMTIDILFIATYYTCTRTTTYMKPIELDRATRLSRYVYTKPGPTPDLGTRVPSRTAKVSFRCRLIGDRRRAGRGAAMESEQ